MQLLISKFEKVIIEPLNKLKIYFQKIQLIKYYTEIKIKNKINYL